MKDQAMMDALFQPGLAASVGLQLQIHLQPATSQGQVLLAPHQPAPPLMI
jgi:hypothetical protein